MIYVKGREKLIDSTIDWDNDDFRAVLVSSSYTPDFDNDEFYADLTGIVAVSEPMTGEIVSGRLTFANNATFINVSGSVVVGVVIYHEAGASPAGSLIAYLDNVDAFPYTPNGNSLELAWDGGAATPSGMVFTLSEIALPTLVGFTTSSSPTINTPTGVLPGDLLVSGWAVRGTGTIEKPAAGGWGTIVTQVISGTGDAGNSCFWRVAGVSEASSHTFGGGGSFGEEVGIMAAFRGCRPYPVGSVRQTSSNALPEIIPGRRHALWVSITMYNSANGGITPTCTWTNATEIGELGATRIAVSMGYTRCDNGPNLTSLSVTATATYLDHSATFAVVPL